MLVSNYNDNEDYVLGYQYTDNKGKEQIIMPNPRFQSYTNLFQNFVSSQLIQTQYPVINCLISFDSEVNIIVSKKSHSEYHISMFDLKTYEQIFDEKIGGNPESYIKVKDVEQNSAGDYYAVAYYDDGNFRIRTFGR